MNQPLMYGTDVSLAWTNGGQGSPLVLIGPAGQLSGPFNNYHAIVAAGGTPAPHKLAFSRNLSGRPANSSGQVTYGDAVTIAFSPGPQTNDVYLTLQGGDNYVGYQFQYTAGAKYDFSPQQAWIVTNPANVNDQSGLVYLNSPLVLANAGFEADQNYDLYAYFDATADPTLGNIAGDVDHHLNPIGAFTGPGTAYVMFY